MEKKPRYSVSRKKILTQYECNTCGVTFQYKHGTLNKYCSMACSAIGKSKASSIFIQNWLAGQIPMEQTYGGVNNQIKSTIRNYLILQAGSKCSKCGWCEINPHTQKVPLQLNHKDGDSTNNNPANLEVLCPNCHALTDCYGIHGKGRKLRYIRSS